MKLIPKLKSKCKKLIFATPWGLSPQGAEYGNENEVHISTWDVQDFIDLGMNADGIGEKDVLLRNNLIAWM